MLFSVQSTIKACEFAISLFFITYEGSYAMENVYKFVYISPQSVFVVVVQSLSPVWLFATPWTATRQASLSFTISQTLLKLMPIESVMPSSHLILCHPLLLLPPIPPSIKVFSNESTLRMRWPKYWSFSFSISPSSEYSGLIPLGLTGLTSLLSKGLSRVFSSTTVWRHQFFSAQLFYSLALMSIHDWKNHSFGYMDLCQQSNVSAF